MKNDLITIIFLLILVYAGFINCRNHMIIIKNDVRNSILLSHFGYYSQGYLHLEIKKLIVPLTNGSKFGFSLDPSTTRSVSRYVEKSNQACFLKDHKMPALILQYNQFNKTMTIETHGTKMGNILIYKDVPFMTDNNSTQLSLFNISAEIREQLYVRLTVLISKFIDRDNASDIANITTQSFKSPLFTTTAERDAVLRIMNQSHLPIPSNDPNFISDLKMILLRAKRTLGGGDKFWTKMEVIWHQLQSPMTFNVDFPFNLSLFFPTSDEEGDYDFYFHNCAPNKKAHEPVEISMTLIEKNLNSFLSAGDQPLPLLFFIMSSVYIVLTIIWSLTLFRSEHMIFKIHYLMLTLLFMKSLSLFFHGINYFELGRKGVPEQGWAVMYYITHLLKGALLFTTIILIGAGWAFFKHMLTSKEKKIFLIVIPLQILANVATIIIDETEESTPPYRTWRNVFLLVDLICCGAILFPVIWSIKQLKDAANVDGKQIQNLQKLKMFRHFYLLIICYIYFTRIIVYLLLISVPFKLTWTVDLFRELSTVVFMIVTGYKFRPDNNNPYLLVPLDDDDDQVTEEQQMEHAWSQSGVMAGVTKINQWSLLASDTDEDEDTVYDKSLLATPSSDHNQGTINNGFIHTSKL